MMVDSVFIKLVRKGAGVGPDYSLKISGRGTVIYEGFENVQVKGERKERIEREEIVKLLSEFKKADFFSLNDVYPVENSEGRSSCIIGISVTDKNGGNKIKNITHFHGDKNVPRKLLNLEEKIDKIVDSKKWVGDPSKVLQARNEPTSKQIESIVTKHEKTADFRKPSKPKSSFLSKKIVAVIALFVAFILVLFLVFQSGIINKILTDGEEVQSNKPPQIQIKSSRVAGYAPLVVFFDCSKDNLNGDLSYIWDFGDNNLSFKEKPAHVFTESGMYNVNLTVSNNNGATINDFLSINVKNSSFQSPKVEINYTSGSGYGLAPLSLSLMGNISGGMPPYDYYWDLGTGDISINKEITYVYKTKDKYIINLYVTDSNGFSGSDIATVTAV